MEATNKTKWAVICGATAIFLLGFLAGVLAMNLYRPALTSAYRMERYQRFERMMDRLNLTPDQRAQVEAILRDTRAQFMEAGKDPLPRFREIRKQSRARIEAVLTPEQRQQFAEMMKDLRWRRYGRWSRNDD